jgi:hypothetical protein
MMIRIGGNENSDMGDVTKELISEKNIKKYLDFFCFFKTVSKMCHFSMTVQKEI